MQNKNPEQDKRHEIQHLSISLLLSVLTVIPGKHAAVDHPKIDAVARAAVAGTVVARCTIIDASQTGDDCGSPKAPLSSRKK